MIKKASAVWKGSLKEGSGVLSTETGVLRDAPYGFKSRFEAGPARTRKNLIAGCACRLLLHGIVADSR